jgi:hypothetical protein
MNDQQEVMIEDKLFWDKMLSEVFNPLKPKLVQRIGKDLVRTLKRTHFTITKINLLTLFKEIIIAYIETHTRPISTECIITDW